MGKEQPLDPLVRGACLLEITQRDKRAGSREMETNDMDVEDNAGVCVVQSCRRPNRWMDAKNGAGSWELEVGRREEKKKKK